ncbi:VMAP-C domain-containing protein [Streptomyces sp. NPDC003374]
MRWFRTQADPYGDPSAHVVTVRRSAEGRAAEVAGAGFLLAPDTVLTCAHVVNDALDRPLLDPRPPGPEDIQVETGGSGGRQRRLARVAYWIPPRGRDGGAVREGDGEWLGDLAVLRVDGAPAGPSATVPERAPMATGQEVMAWHGSRDSAGYARLTVTSLNGALSYADGAATGMAVGPGFSGGPLWCADEHAVVGLVAAHFMPARDPDTGAELPFSPQDTIRRSYTIPWQQAERELSRLGVLAAVPPGSCDPDDPAHLLLVELIDRVLSSPNGRCACAQRLATACGVGYGSDVTPPTAEEFAGFLLTHPRALAALSAILRRDDPEAADQFLAVGNLSPVPRLLSPQEYERLHRHLRTLDRSVLERFAETVRAALPHLPSPPGDTPDALIDHLEQFPGDGHSADGEPRVPALLRVVEYLATLCPAPKRAELRLWADGVGRRLGIPRGGLSERRAEAEDWGRTARERSVRVRVLVQVTRAGNGRHRLQLWCDEGAGPRRVSADSVTTYTPSQAAREVLRVLASVTASRKEERPALVEVLVDRAGLNLPVDEWDARGPDDLVPGVLGVQFPLVVHCPELLRLHQELFVPHWRTRWSRLESGGTFVVDEPIDPDTLYYRLVNQLDTVRVCVAVPPGSRDGIVQTCLAMGIPVVVWDRGPDGCAHAVEHMAHVATPELPEGVRDYRANARARPPEFPGRPVLAWADADRTVPRLSLTPPQESA